MQEESIISTSGKAKERAEIGSFSFKSTNTAIQQELTRRATSGKNVEVYMPSIRLSSTIFPGLLNDEYKDCKYFCVGTHGYPQNPNSRARGVKNELMTDIFSVNDGSYPIVGYTIQKTPNGDYAKIIRAKDESARNLSVPPPGITELTISRNTNGRITKLHGTISVPSYAQYQVLFDNFLIPGIGILAEVANVYTNDSTFQEPIPFIDLAGTELEKMSKIENNNPASVPYIPLERIIEKSVESKGAYTAFFGRLGNFKTSIKNTEYVIDFECVGVGDASMGIQMYEPFTKSNEKDRTKTGVSNTTVEKWFVPTTENVISPFYSLLLRILNNAADQPNSDLAQKYGKHVNMFKLGDLKGFTHEAVLKKISNDLSNVTSIVGGFENPIFISWPFFVNIILNDRVLGIRQLYGEDKPYSLKLIHELDDYVFGASEKNYDHPNEPLIGSHGRLRSIDAKVMIINNENAQLCVLGDASYGNIVGNTDSLSKFDPRYQSTGNFHAYKDINAGTLSHGVWLNAHNIVEIFKNSPTIHDAISTLLTQMNRASANYWNLALDFDEHNLLDFVVVDLNFHNARSSKLQKAYKDSYIFNKPFVVEQGTSIKYGSELISADIDVALKASLVASAVYAVQSGTHGHSGNQLSAFSTKNNVPIWDLDITRFYNKKENKPIDTSKLSSIDNGILTKSTFSIRGIEPIIKPGSKSLSEFAASGELDRQITQYDGLVNRDAYQIVFARIQQQQSDMANKIASNFPTEKLTRFGVSLFPYPNKDIKTVGDVRTKIDEINKKLRPYDDEMQERLAIWKTFKPEALETEKIQQSIRDAEQRNLSRPSKIEALTKDELDLYTAWIQAEAATTSSEEDFVKARYELQQLTDARDTVQNSPAGTFKQLKDDEKRLTEQGLKLTHLMSIFGMIEMMPTYMTQKIQDSIDRDANNNFGFNGSLPIKSTLTMVGIGGFRSGEIIRIGRLPEPFTDAAFLILGTTDSISPGGWFTTVEAKYLPASMFRSERRDRPESNEGCGDLPKERTPSDKFKPFSGPDLLPAPNSTDIAQQYFGGACPELKALIASGEGNYESINRGKGGDTVPLTDPEKKREYFISTNGKRLTEMTLGEILEKMNRRDGTRTTQSNTIFAAGKYQITPDTLRGAIRTLKLSPSSVFNAILQEKLGDYLITQKPDRSNLNQYLRDCEYTNINAAALDLAKEFASFPVPDTGLGYYEGQRNGVQKVEDVMAVLRQCRARNGCKA